MAPQLEKHCRILAACGANFLRNVCHLTTVRPLRYAERTIALQSVLNHRFGTWEMILRYLDNIFEYDEGWSTSVCRGTLLPHPPTPNPTPRSWSGCSASAWKGTWTLLPYCAALASPMMPCVLKWWLGWCSEVILLPLITFFLGHYSFHHNASMHF